MSQKSNTNTLVAEEIVKGIRRATRKRYCAEDKIRIVLDGLRGEHLIAELCPPRRHCRGPATTAGPRNSWEPANAPAPPPPAGPWT